MALNLSYWFKSYVTSPYFFCNARVTHYRADNDLSVIGRLAVGRRWRLVFPESGWHLFLITPRKYPGFFLMKYFCLLLQLGRKIISWNPATLTEFWKNFNRMVRTKKEKRQVGLSVVIYDWSLYFPVKIPREH